MRLLQHVAFQLPRGKPWLYVYQSSYMQTRFTNVQKSTWITRLWWHTVHKHAWWGRIGLQSAQCVGKANDYLELISGLWPLQAPLVGRLSDRFGRKPFLAIVLLVSTLAPVMLACHQTFGMTLYAYFPAQVRSHSLHIRHYFNFQTTKVHKLCLLSLHKKVAAVILSVAIASMPVGNFHSFRGCPLHQHQVYSPAVHICRWISVVLLLALKMRKKKPTDNKISCKAHIEADVAIHHRLCEHNLKRPVKILGISSWSW